MKTNNQDKLKKQWKFAKIVLSIVGVLLALMILIAIFAPKETSEDTVNSTTQSDSTSIDVARRAIHDKIKITNTKVIQSEDGKAYTYVFIAANDSDSTFNGEVRITLHSKNAEGERLVQRFTFDTSLESSKSTFLTAESSSAPESQGGGMESYSYELYNDDDATRGADKYENETKITDTFETL